MSSLPTTYQQFIHISRYARWLDDKQRRETWDETVSRYCDFFSKRFEGKYDDVIYNELKPSILNVEVLPSLRALMTAGHALERENIAGYNCAYIAVSSKRNFSEILYILMNGTGCGFSCERQEVANLPTIPEKLTKNGDVIVVEDSKLGWAKAYNKLINSLYDGDIPEFDYSKVRPAGARLKTFGGRASGPKPLKKLFDFTIEAFKKSTGRKLQSIEVHDIVCTIAETIVVGGVRRSALISLSNLSDQRMRDAKSGQWWIEHPERALANNSIAYTEKPEPEIFMEEWLALVKSKSGERGIFNRVSAQKQADKWGKRDPSLAYGVNPCCVTGDTLILTDKGHVPIIETVGKDIVIWNGEQWSEVTPFYAGNHDTYVVELSDGTEIACTGNHKFVLADGYRGRTFRKTTDELNVGDKLAKFSMPVVSEGIDYEIDAYSQGFYSGDGNTNYEFSSVYEPKYPCIPRLIGTFGSEDKENKKIRWRHGEMLPKNFVPIGGSLNYCLNWLAGILDSDGTVTRDKNGNGFQIAAVDKKFLLDIKLMLTRMGVRAKVVRAHDEGMRVMPDGHGGRAEYFCQTSSRLLIGNMDVYKLGKMGLKTERLEWHKNPPQRDARQFVSVVSVAPHTKQDVYCFEEQINHTGTFNGIVTGQSEIILRPTGQMCNLSTIIVRAEDDKESLKKKARLATILGTLQASLTDFHFIGENWKRNTTEEALLGVSLCGIMDNKVMSGQSSRMVLKEWLNEIRDHTVEVNAEWAKNLNINPSAAICCVKPEGTSSQMVDAASGIHTRHSKYYLRTVRSDKKDPLYQFMQAKGIYCEDDVMKPETGAVFYFPIKAPDDCMTRDSLTALEQLDIWLFYQDEWCHHKPSVTISVSDDEWVEVGAWVWKHFDAISGVSFLPKSNHSYTQAPYQEISEVEYNDWIAKHPMPEIDWSELSEFEKEDTTTGTQQYACSAGVCELV